MSTKQGHILVVDDQANTRTFLATLLKRQGYSVVTVENGLQALETLRNTPFDLMLLDINMPEMDGYQVLQRLKTDETLQNIPVIVISALDEMKDIIKCIQLGAVDHLPKRFNQFLFKARIEACIEQKRLHDQEVAYLQQVDRLTEAVVAIENENFKLENIDGIAARQDELGQLARVFQDMARKIYTREKQLKQQVLKLRIEIDKSKQAQQVEKITQSSYFKKLHAQAETLRNKLGNADS